MKFIAALTLTVISVSTTATTFAARIPIKTSSGPVKTDSYIVILKAGANQTGHIKSLTEHAARTTDYSAEITHTYDVFNGYSAHLTGAALTHVLTSSEVESVETDGIASINYEVNEEDEDSATISVERDFTEASAAGAGVDIYGIDTGIYTQHTCFGGRAIWGATYGGYASKDGNGHGTHTAGTAVGKTYGVATSARIIAVKVLSDQGSGSYSDIISGVNWVFNNVRSTRRPSIATMSLGGPTSAALDSAVRNAIASGIHFTIAAGNSAKDASTTSPADVVPANTIGAIDGSTNRMASFSNFGSLIDVFAPGVNILSAYIGSTTATARLSGTSMATPYVAGILAVALGKYGQVSPASLSASLKSHAKAVVTGQPVGTTKLRAYLW